VKSKVPIVLSVLICGLALHASKSRAQSFRLNAFRSAERPDDGFGVRRLSGFEHLRWAALLSADYAHDPLVIEQTRGGDSELTRVVRHHLTLKLDLSVALWNRLIVFAGLDPQPVEKGPRLPSGVDVPEADGGGMGDVSLGARARLLGQTRELFGLGAQATLIVPAAGAQAYRGEEGVAFRPELIAELRPKLIRFSFNLGALVRRQQRLLDATVSSQLLYAVAAAVPLPKRFEVTGELWGAMAFEDFGGKTSTPFEFLLGGKYRAENGVVAGLAAGRGVTRGIGAPDARLVAQLGYQRPLARAKPSMQPAPTPPAPALPPPAPVDRDGDGTIDASDACPDQPEDHDGFEDGDGCPDADNDKDGVVDAEDVCPDLAGTPEERGCPGKVRVSEEGELIVFQQVLFELNGATILTESLPDMEAVRVVLVQHPEMTKVRIEGHTDSLGQDAANLELSQRRAAAVAQWLIEHGVEATRLDAYGCGEQHPIASEATPAGKAKNRRVTFQVVEPPPADQTRSTPPAGCVPAR
jgi:outer membrane protein OmpA-like peptidoglycan-associated protein